jgi:hypothetical protein
MFEVFVHENNTSPRLWAPEASTRRVVFGSLVYGFGDIWEKFVSKDSAPENIRRKRQKGYDYIGLLKTPADAIALIEIFNKGRISTKPNDPAGVLRCAEMIIKNDYPGNQRVASDGCPRTAQSKARARNPIQTRTRTTS